MGKKNTAVNKARRDILKFARKRKGLTESKFRAERPNDPGATVGVVRIPQPDVGTERFFEAATRDLFDITDFCILVRNLSQIEDPEAVTEMTYEAFRRRFETEKQ